MRDDAPTGIGGERRAVQGPATTPERLPGAPGLLTAALGERLMDGEGTERPHGVLAQDAADKPSPSRRWMSIPSATESRQGGEAR